MTPTSHIPENHCSPHAPFPLMSHRGGYCCSVIWKSNSSLLSAASPAAHKERSVRAWGRGRRRPPGETRDLGSHAAWGAGPVPSPLPAPAWGMAPAAGGPQALLRVGPRTPAPRPQGLLPRECTHAPRFEAHPPRCERATGSHSHKGAGTLSPESPGRWASGHLSPILAARSTALAPTRKQATTPAPSLPAAARRGPSSPGSGFPNPRGRARGGHTPALAPLPSNGHEVGHSPPPTSGPRLLAPLHTPIGCEVFEGQVLLS